LGREVAIPVTALALLAYSAILNILKAPGLIGDLKFVAAHLPLDADEPIEVHTFSLEPAFKGLAGVGVEFDKHSSFKHVDKDTFSVSVPSGLHAMGKSFGSLAREASECVLREVAWHRNS
jgi:hypothetical protein